MIHELLKSHKLILASASPRRKEIFGLMGLKPLVVKSGIVEPIDTRHPRFIVQSHALHKALAVIDKFDSEAVIIGCDTLVSIDGAVLGKPMNKPEAVEYLRMLSGKTHAVYSGICILFRNSRYVSYERSLVRFTKMTDPEIEAYADTNEPYDKAGGYGIQGLGCQFIKGITGCYFNVMGFPVHLFYKMLNEILAD